LAQSADPATANLKFTAMSRFAGDRDVVLVGYRGIDGSVGLDCPEVTPSPPYPRRRVGPIRASGGRSRVWTTGAGTPLSKRIVTAASPMPSCSARVARRPDACASTAPVAVLAGGAAL
jgi:hypothetical protein